MAKYCDEILGDLLLKEPLPNYPVGSHRSKAAAQKQTGKSLAGNISRLDYAYVPLSSLMAY